MDNSKHSIDVFNCQLQVDALDSNKRQFLSDGYHTFEELYEHRMTLFAVICNNFRNKFWKSKLHADGTMFKDYFIVGCNTANGNFSYHYHIENWDRFNCEELDRAPEWDGHTSADINRLFTLDLEVKHTLLNFGQAVQLLKNGKMIARTGWNGTGMFVFRQEPSKVDANFVEKMTSLPENVKILFAARRDQSFLVSNKKGAGKQDFPEHRILNYQNQYALVKQNNEINGWHPSVADCEAEDWYEYK